MNDIDFKAIAEDLIWRNVVDHKNEGSGYYIMDSNCGGYTKGSIHFGLAYSSVVNPDFYHELTWKELCLALKTKGYDNLIPDGHDCSICINRENCLAPFKDVKNQERCNRWSRGIN